MQPGLLHYRQICLETVEFGLFVRRPLVVAVGQIRGLQRIGSRSYISHSTGREDGPAS